MQCRRHRRCGFDPWVRKIPWRRKWQPTHACRIPWAEEPGGLRSLGKESEKLKLLSTHAHMHGGTKAFWISGLFCLGEPRMVFQMASEG